jgi:hypothetical protein
MKKSLCFIGLIFITISLPAQGKTLGDDDHTINTIVEPIFQDFIQSFEVVSYEKFMKHLSIDVIEDVDKNKFLKQSQGIKLRMGTVGESSNSVNRMSIYAAILAKDFCPSYTRRSKSNHEI